jgi:hypothetical protein
MFKLVRRSAPSLLEIFGPVGIVPTCFAGFGLLGLLLYYGPHYFRYFFPGH